jgi:hypothetical protein
MSEGAGAWRWFTGEQKIPAIATLPADFFATEDTRLAAAHQRTVNAQRAKSDERTARIRAEVGRIQERLGEARDAAKKEYASLIESLRTPFQIFKETYEKLAKLRLFDIIDLKQFERGIQNAAGILRQSLGMEYKPVSAIEPRTQEYFTMMGQLEAANRTTDRITELIAEAKRQTNLQQWLLNVLKGMQTEGQTL